MTSSINTNLAIPPYINAAESPTLACPKPLRVFQSSSPPASIQALFKTPVSPPPIQLDSLTLDLYDVLPSPRLPSPNDSSEVSPPTGSLSHSSSSSDLRTLSSPSTSLSCSSSSSDLRSLLSPSGSQLLTPSTPLSRSSSSSDLRAQISPTWPKEEELPRSIFTSSQNQTNASQLPPLPFAITSWSGIDYGKSPLEMEEERTYSPTENESKEVERKTPILDDKNLFSIKEGSAEEELDSPSDSDSSDEEIEGPKDRRMNPRRSENDLHPFNDETLSIIPDLRRDLLIKTFIYPGKFAVHLHEIERTSENIMDQLVEAKPFHPITSEDFAFRHDTINHLLKLLTDEPNIRRQVSGIFLTTISLLKTELLYLGFAGVDSEPTHQLLTTLQQILEDF